MSDIANKLEENNRLLDILIEQNGKPDIKESLLENGLELADKTNEKLSNVIDKIKTVSDENSIKMEIDEAEIVSVKGDKGKDGEKGNTGEKGDNIKGDKGDDGERGEKGDTIKGEDGKDGHDGLDGSDGLDGNDGKNGIDGKSGKDGKDADIKEIIKVLEKRKISYKDLKDKPDIYKGKLMGAGYLREVTDVEILANPSNGQALVYNKAKKQWIPTTLSSSTTNVYSETPAGTINGSNKVFTLASTPTTNSLQLYLNGAFQTGGGEDYTIAGDTITFINAPLSISVLKAFYNY